RQWRLDDDARRVGNGKELRARLREVALAEELLGDDAVERRTHLGVPELCIERSEVALRLRRFAVRRLQRSRGGGHVELRRLDILLRDAALRVQLLATF